MRKRYQWVLIVLVIVFGAVIATRAQPSVPSQAALELSLSFSGQVQPLQVTFQVPDETGEGFFEMTLTRTATAIFSDGEATYWLTVPTALTYPGSGLSELPFTGLQLFGSGASVQVVEVVDDFRGFYALLREGQHRETTPVSLGFLLPPHHAQEVGLIYFDAGDNVFPVQRISPTFHKVLDSFRFEAKDLSGFHFKTLQIIGDSAIGAPLFHQTIEAFSGEVSYILVGMLIDSKLVSVPFFTETATNAPLNNTILELIDPSLVAQETL